MMDNKQMKTRKKIQRELPPVGTKLEHKFKGKLYVAEIVRSQSDPSKLIVRLQGRNYESLSGAAKSISGNSANGWVFWHNKSRKNP